GHEGHIVSRATSLTRPGTPIFLEFHPSFLRKAGGVRTLIGSLEQHYTDFLDMRSAQLAETAPAFLPVAQLERFAARVAATERGYTDILVVRRAVSAHAA